MSVGKVVNQKKLLTQEIRINLNNSRSSMQMNTIYNMHTPRLELDQDFRRR